MCYEKFFEKQAEDDDSSPLPYPNLEEAVNNDAPVKVNIYRLMCRNVTDEQIINRAVFLQKTAIVCSLLKNLTLDQRLTSLIKLLRYWQKPEDLLQTAVKEFGKDLASWTDEYGNKFFWYLYSLPVPVSQEMIDILPDEIFTSFEQPNCYGISPADQWQYYRKGSTFL